MKIGRVYVLFCFIFIFGWVIPLKADISGARSVVVATIDNVYGDIVVDYETDDVLFSSVGRSLDQHLTPALNFEKFTKLILASHWKKATPEQRQQLTEILKAFLFRTLTKAIVEHRHVIISYKENISIMDAVPGRNEERALVSVVVENPSRGPINIDFRMGFENSQWKAYDVIVQDVSFAINYRAILNSEIRKHGIEKVLETFASKLKFESP